MSQVNILNIQILTNPAPFLSNYVIEITFECLSQLKEDLEFTLVYIGSIQGQAIEQELDCLLVGPVPIGINKFQLETPPPKVENLNPLDVMDVTGVYLKCIYKNKEYLRCSYWVKAEYDNEIMRLEPPAEIAYPNLVRLLSDPRVTRFPIPWDGTEQDLMPPPQPEADALPALNLNQDIPSEDDESEEADGNDSEGME